MKQHSPAAIPTPSHPTMRFDVVAGLTAAAVVLPKAMAYATVAGLPVAVGLYTAFIPMVIYALLGTSRVLSVSSTTTLAILAGARAWPGGARRRSGPADRCRCHTDSPGGRDADAGFLLRLGFVANFISTPVLTGFKAGIGLVIVLDQVPKLLGIHITKQGFFRDLLSVAAPPARDLPDHPGGGRGDAGRADRHGASVAAFSGAAGRGGRRHRRLVVLRPAGAGGHDRRPDSAGTAVTDPARSGSDLNNCCRARSASR